MNIELIKSNINKVMNDNTIFYISEHKDSYISKNALKYLLNNYFNLLKDMNIITHNSIEYILLNRVYDMIKTINDYLMIDIQKLFGLVTILTTSKFDIVNLKSYLHIQSIQC